MREWLKRGLSGAVSLREADAIILEIDSEHFSGKARILFNVTPIGGRNFIAEYLDHLPEDTPFDLRIGGNIRVYYDLRTPSKVHLTRPVQTG